MTECWFDYKTVIVSGASSGIGKGLVKRLIADHGCRVIGIARNEAKMRALVEELGDRRIVLPCNGHYFHRSKTNRHLIHAYADIVSSFCRQYCNTGVPL